MGTLHVEVEQDHLERLVGRPLRGLGELVWNAIDADATEVNADLARSTMGGLDSVVVTDNGTGITRETAERHFSHLGGSWKKAAVFSEGGRPLHGHAGQGRWAAYGLGDVVRWDSVADQVTGERARLRITGRRARLTEFEVSDLEPTSDATGTVVEVSQLTDPALKVLETSDVAEHLTSTFALVLEQHPVTVTWRGITLDPKSIQAQRHEEDLFVEGIEGPLQLVIIEWATPQNGRSLHLCDASGASLWETRAGIHAPGFEFSAYLRWGGFRERSSMLLLGDTAEEPIPSLLEAAKVAMRSYFRGRSKERGSELVEAWKQDSSYPYTSAPATHIDRLERELFDIVAVAAAPVVEGADVRSRKLALRLMREALETSPASLHRVLQEVLELPEEHLQELRHLLETTTLSAIIAATRKITDRLNFLIALETLVFGSDFKATLLERRQLHRILASETWIFREEYALTADDVSLRTALRDHIGLLGRDDLAPEEVASADVVDSDGGRVIVDLMLSRVVEQRRDHREHVVIELKRPSVHIGMDQIGQIARYAEAVASDSRFAQTDTRWEFWIVGDEIDSAARMLAVQKNQEPGVVAMPSEHNMVIRAVTWAQVIRDARHRLSFVKEALAYESTESTAMAYLNEKHAEYLPTVERTSGGV